MDAMIRLPGASTGTQVGAPGDSSQVDGKGAAGLLPVHNLIAGVSLRNTSGSSLSAFIGGVFVKLSPYRKPRGQESGWQDPLDLAP